MRQSEGEGHALRAEGEEGQKCNVAAGQRACRGIKERGERRRQRSGACVWAWTRATAPGCALFTQRATEMTCNDCFELMWLVSRVSCATGTHKTCEKCCPAISAPSSRHTRASCYNFTRSHGLTARLPQVTQKASFFAKGSILNTN